jgi:S1-C subfamily serine protease
MRLIAALATSIAVHAAATPGWLGMDYTWSQPKGGHRVLHVQRVAPGGPAQRAGIQPGDIVTHMNARAVDFGDELELLLFLNEQRPGDRLLVTIVREGRRFTLPVSLGVMSAAALAKRAENLEVARRKRIAAAAQLRKQ